MDEQNLISGPSPIDEDFNSGDFKREIARINNLVSDTNKLTTYVILVLVVMVVTLLVTVAGMVIDAYQNQSAAYQSLTSQIQELQELRNKS